MEERRAGWRTRSGVLKHQGTLNGREPSKEASDGHPKEEPMRFGVLTLAAALLFSVPVFAQNAAPAPAKEVLERFQLTNQNPNDVMELLFPPVPLKKGEVPKPGANLLPIAITAAAGFPLDHSLIARGTPDAVKKFRDAVLTIDLKVEKLPNDRAATSLMPRHGKPTDLRERLLSLPGAGDVALQDGRLTLQGKAGWVRAALREAFLAEIKAP